ncbi:MAG: hypothetical protein KatS3mg113_0829 [Planctomycetaceae bacterium]|nr:MAG: hypothetical protein KatS3mg113_0829 [Planctomycetaceae bacterium]
MNPIRVLLDYIADLSKIAVPRIRLFLRNMLCYLYLMAFLIGLGCQRPSRPHHKDETASTPTVAVPHRSEPETSSAAAFRSEVDRKQPNTYVKSERTPIRLGSPSTASTSQVTPSSTTDAAAPLRPFQIWLGRWQGVSRQAHVEQVEWVWDFRTNPAQPSLVVRIPEGHYMREGRLAYDPEHQLYRLEWTAPEGSQRVLLGTLTKPIRDEPGDDQQLHRTFRLEFTEPDSKRNEQWRIVFDQQDNHRYIVEIERRRGQGAFQRVDTIHMQREGTSFAISSTDYGERTCIISQGLGTMTVSYQGKTYWVCCTGCKAAFEEDPQRWLALWKQKQKTPNR